MDPEGWSRTSIFPVDGRLLFQLGYLGVVLRGVPTQRTRSQDGQTAHAHVGCASSGVMFRALGQREVGSARTRDVRLKKADERVVFLFGLTFGVHDAANQFNQFVAAESLLGTS